MGFAIGVMLSTAAYEVARQDLLRRMDGLRAEQLRVQAECRRAPRRDGGPGNMAMAPR